MVAECLNCGCTGHYEIDCPYNYRPEQPTYDDVKDA